MLMRVLAAVLMTAAVVPACAAETTPQPLSRADCEKAGMQWSDNANVCGGKEATAKPEGKPENTRKSESGLASLNARFGVGLVVKLSALVSRCRPIKGSAIVGHGIE